MTTATIDERTQRLREAIAKNDKKYLEDYEQGMDAGTTGQEYDVAKKSQGWLDGYVFGEKNIPVNDPTNKEAKSEHYGQTSEDVTDPSEEEDEFVGHPVNIGFHPLGGLSVAVRQADGTVAQARITVEQAWTTIGHLQALTSMLIHATYAQMAQMQQQDIVLPGR